MSHKRSKQHHPYCLNCHYPLSEFDKNCSQCGQKPTDGRTTMHDLLHEFIHTLFHLDGKFFWTLKHLFVPGKLTIEFFKGHHKRYAHPIQLFLVLGALTFSAVVSRSHKAEEAIQKRTEEKKAQLVRYNYLTKLKKISLDLRGKMDDKARKNVVDSLFLEMKEADFSSKEIDSDDKKDFSEVEKNGTPEEQFMAGYNSVPSKKADSKKGNVGSSAAKKEESKRSDFVASIEDGIKDAAKANPNVKIDDDSTSKKDEYSEEEFLGGLVKVKTKKSDSEKSNSGSSAAKKAESKRSNNDSDSTNEKKGAKKEGTFKEGFSEGWDSYSEENSESKKGNIETNVEKIVAEALKRKDYLKSDIYHLDEDSTQLNAFVNMGDDEKSMMKVPTREIFDLTTDSIIKKYKITNFISKLTVKQYIKVIRDGDSMFHSFMGKLIWVTLLLIPILALFFLLIYRRSKKFYVEHVVFLLHYNTTLFVGLILTFYIYDYWTPIIGWFFLWAAIHFFFSLKNFYRQGFGKTFLKFFILFNVYFFLALFVGTLSIVASFFLL